MKNPEMLTGLEFFDIREYHSTEDFVFNVSDSPRPHFCMGLITAGSAVFRDSMEEVDIQVNTGEIIFVPMGSRYVATWKTDGEGHLNYITMHFTFDDYSPLSELQGFLIQRIVPAAGLETRLRSIMRLQDGNDGECLIALGIFFDLLGQILPTLKKQATDPIEPRIRQALLYVRQHYRDVIRVEDLAACCNMSLSRFFPCFHNAVGMTPVDYINRYRVSRAIMLLVAQRDITVETISERVGFESPTYFRRVFRKVTGKTPKEYRNSKVEI